MDVGPNEPADATGGGAAPPSVEPPSVAAPSVPPPSSAAPASDDARCSVQSTGQDGDGLPTSTNWAFPLASLATFADVTILPDGRSISAIRSHEGNVTIARHGSEGVPPSFGQR